ncbi:hypothetical protein ACE38W_14710 [Chitinophaga sp. Hz27]|uniref:hypothetical protein n=1 Tax=Chitinophaga sp. Hz27 TaxID=3347169 RepID=UPI0035E23E39
MNAETLKAQFSNIRFDNRQKLGATALKAYCDCLEEETFSKLEELEDGLGPVYDLITPEEEEVSND